MNTKPLHLSLQAFQTVLVAVLLFETPRSGSCRSAVLEKDVLRSPQVISTTGHEEWSATDHADAWRVCGKLSLPSQYRIYAADGLLQHSEGLEVAISLDTGVVRCRCRHLVSTLPSVDTIRHQVVVEVQSVDREDDHFKINLPLEFPCHISFCRRNPTTILELEQQSGEHISLQLNSECSVPPTSLHLMGDGAVVLIIPAATRDSRPSAVAYGVRQTQISNVSMLEDQHHQSQICVIDVIRSIELPNGSKDVDFPDTYSRQINFMQSVPLDPTNCIDWNKIRHGRHRYQLEAGPAKVLLSVKRLQLTAQDLLHSDHNPQESLTPHQVEPSTPSQPNAIHQKGDHMMLTTRESVVKRGAGRIRQIRQTSTSNPVFDQFYYMASVRENSPPGTMVMRVRATGSGPITYSMTTTNGFSSNLFRMNSSSGVVTTAGLSRLLLYQ